MKALHSLAVLMASSPRFADEIFKYLSIPANEFSEASKMFEQPIMDMDYFMNLADSFRSPHLWRLDNGQWKLRHHRLGQRTLGSG